jgi:hypothetical protein
MATRRKDSEQPSEQQIRDILAQIKTVARAYREITGRPLGVTGEIAEYEACRIMRLSHAPPRQPGYDAIDSKGTRIQIKGRVILPVSKPGQRLGSIRFDHQWDEVWLVLMTDSFETTAIYAAKRRSIYSALSKAGSRARNDRGQLGVTAFMSLGERIWSRT